MRSGDPSEWDYVTLVRALIGDARAVLDLGTGDGEVFASLSPLPPLSIATEAWPPNVPVAQARLAAVGARVVWSAPAPDNTAQAVAEVQPSLPFRDGTFDLVIDRHESFVAAEVARVLRRGGRFVTQQVGARNLLELNDALGVPFVYSGWHLVTCCQQLEAAGLRVLDQREAFTDVIFEDVEAIVAYLEAVPWQAPGLTRPRSARSLERLVRRLPLRARAHRFYVAASNA